jgi:hypothetical protein
MLSAYSPRRERRWKIDNIKVVRTSETALDRDNGLAKVEYTVTERKNDGTCKTLRESHVNRFFSVDEMRTILSSASFEPLELCAGFNKTEPITDDTWHIVAVARRK